MPEGRPSRDQIDNHMKWAKNTDPENWIKHKIQIPESKRINMVKKKYFKGMCHICQKFPLYIVKYKFPNAVLIEYYCQEHIDKFT